MDRRAFILAVPVVATGVALAVDAEAAPAQGKVNGIRGAILRNRDQLAKLYAKKEGTPYATIYPEFRDGSFYHDGVATSDNTASDYAIFRLQVLMARAEPDNLIVTSYMVSCYDPDLKDCVFSIPGATIEELVAACDVIERWRLNRSGPSLPTNIRRICPCTCSCTRRYTDEHLTFIRRASGLD